MSQQLISRSPDLRQLQDEGLEICIQEGYLLIHGIPYVNANKEITHGTLVSNLELSGDRTATPRNHVVSFAGSHPCHKDGVEIEQVRHQVATQNVTSDLTIERSFSCKPAGGYSDYYQKIRTYIRIISSPAKSIDPNVTENSFKVIVAGEDSGVFRYVDTNSSRADINALSQKLKQFRIGIIGLGGTGSYVLDLVAKTPVKEIHLFDGDDFLQHNAFRAPGAPSLEQLRARDKKAVYFKTVYSNIHSAIIDHPEYVDSSELSNLPELDFVFVCIDDGSVKAALFEYLEQQELPFIDVGIGLEVVNDQLIGIVRTTMSTPGKRDHIDKTVPMGDEIDNAYTKNIQIAELNALNASFAVIKWKKLCGFYQDLDHEHHSTYSLNVNQLISEEPHEA